MGSCVANVMKHPADVDDKEEVTSSKKAQNGLST
jgi:hypothetical protein